MASALEPHAAGKKRACTVEREMEKCEPCRRKRIKCLPKGRDWSKGEKCGACVRKNNECGPNVRANRPSRPLNHPQVTPSAEELPRPSNILEKVPTGISSQHIEAAQIVKEGAFELGNLRKSTGTDIRTLRSEARQDEFHGHGNLFTSKYISCLGSMITGSPSLTPSTSNSTNADSLHNRLVFIALRLRTLGSLRELFQKFDHDRRAIGPESFQPTQSHSESCKCPYCSAFSSTLNRIIRSFTVHLSELHEKLHPIDLFHAEKSLLRVSRTIEAFFEVTRSYISQDDHELDDINTVYHSVNRRLLTISIAEGDHAEVGRLRQILAQHDFEVASQLMDSLGDTSIRMRSTLDTLKLPSEIQKAFKVDTADEFYPPLHIALNYRIPLSAHRLQCISPQDLWAKDPLNRNAVHVAAASSHTEFLRGVGLTPELLKDRDIFGNTPLMVAGYHGDYNSFQILWDTGVGRELRDAQSRSIMIIACFVGSREIVEFLLLRGVSQHDRNMIVNHGALYMVAARNHVELCKYLLEHSRTQGQFTPCEKNEAFQVARENRHTEILELLHTSTHIGNTIQRFPGGTQPGQSSEIERRQTSSVPGCPHQPQCPPQPTVTSTSVPTPGYPSTDEDFFNFLQDLPGPWDDSASNSSLGLFG